MGWLLRYLFGPGESGDHRDPRLVAAWAFAGDLAGLRPVMDAAGRREVRRLIGLLEQPVHAGVNPPPLPVWHCSVHNHGDDPVLSDGQWREIAAEIMAGVGLAPHGDEAAVRRVAVRHAENHVHLVATLVRQDGRTEWGWHDHVRAQATARDLERRFGLHRVAPRGHSAGRPPEPAELNKAARQGREEVPRDRLRREVRTAAGLAVDEASFFDRLRVAGLLVQPRRGRRGGPDGYAVATADHRSAVGAVIWYGGGRLARDLTLPALRRRWRGSAG
ncbi:hypothetical protein GCM10027615_46460 [Plantactinospora veratri]